MSALAPTPPKHLIRNVDDDAAERYARRRTLERAGFEVPDAGFGQQIDLLDTHQPVPVMLAVIFMRSQGDALDIQASLPGAAMVAKPIDVGELVAAVRTGLQREVADLFEQA
jgi:DNA-binding response OmpR family regulator